MSEPLNTAQQIMVPFFTARATAELRRAGENHWPKAAHAPRGTPARKHRPARRARKLLARERGLQNMVLTAIGDALKRWAHP